MAERSFDVDEFSVRNRPSPNDDRGSTKRVESKDYDELMSELIQVKAHSHLMKRCCCTTSSIPQCLPYDSPTVGSELLTVLLRLHSYRMSLENSRSIASFRISFIPFHQHCNHKTIAFYIYCIAVSTNVELLLRRGNAPYSILSSEPSKEISILDFHLVLQHCFLRRCALSGYSPFNAFLCDHRHCAP